MSTSTHPGLAEKVQLLHALLGALEGGALVAFSGGTDSALLAVEAAGVLGARSRAVIADSPTLPRAELAAARAFARGHGLSLDVIETREMENPAFVGNDAFRCYHCKEALFSDMRQLAAVRGVKHLLFGAIADDAGDWRPGMKAAVEKGVRAPLMEAGFTKEDVRQRSRDLGLETAEKPSSACLSSRFPEGRPIRLEDLAKVERAEAILKSLGFGQCRVRLQGDAARIEVDRAELTRMVETETRSAVCTGLKSLGFRFVALDLEGFRSGSLSPRPKE